MNIKKRIIYFQISIIAVSLTILGSCHVGRFFIYNTSGIKDYKIFPSRPLEASLQPFYFQVSAQEKAPKEVTDYNGKKMTFGQFLENSKTVAFLVIRRDSIQYEHYFNNYDQDNIVASFSMAKSVLSMLIGCAIDEQLIKSVDEPVTNYIPELKKNGFEKVKILHLLQMTSGIKFNEGYFNPFGKVAQFYYGRNLKKYLFRLTLEKEPGTGFSYKSGNTQLLGFVLERALKGKPITTYLQEKIWSPIGMEYTASWSTDKKKNGLEKTFCCLNARARDFAKLGRLYLNKGNWNGKQLISEHWVNTSTEIDTTAGSSWFYQYQWWLNSKDGGDFMAVGFLGQYIYVNPEKQLIIVRLGKKEGGVDWWTLFHGMAEKY